MIHQDSMILSLSFIVYLTYSVVGKMWLMKFKTKLKSFSFVNRELNFKNKQTFRLNEKERERENLQL